MDETANQLTFQAERFQKAIDLSDVEGTHGLRHTTQSQDLYAMFAESGAPGIVLVVVRGESSLVLGYRETERGKDQAPDDRSLFRQNSDRDRL